MNQLPSESANRVDRDAASADVRELLVTNDFRSIPAAELRTLSDSLGQWLGVLFRYKILRSKLLPAYAIELRRMIKGEAKHIPKRILRHFDALKAKLEPLNFAPGFYANVPALGPYSAAVMAMSRQDGEIHMIASQIVTQDHELIKDEGYFGFTTWLSDENLVVTVSLANLPRPREGVDRIIVDSDDPTVLLKKHRQRLRKLEIQPVAASNLFQRVEDENRRQTDDLLRRRVIRPATPAEVTRIRKDIRV